MIGKRFSEFPKIFFTFSFNRWIELGRSTSRSWYDYGFAIEEGYGI
jgi:hypothetical protein